MKFPLPRPHSFLQTAVLSAVFGLALGSASYGETPNLSAMRKKVEENLAKAPIESHFDQNYAGNSNPKQAVDLFLPKVRKSTAPLPVICFIHGGGWMAGDRISSAGTTALATMSGEYAGVSIGYRLSQEAKWPAQIYDCKAAIRWIRAHAKEYNLDPDKIGVWGASAGGHLVSLLGTTNGVEELEGDVGPNLTQSSNVTCVVNFCGPSDFLLPLMTANGKPVLEDEAVIGLLGGNSEQKKELAKEASPVTYITSDDVPFLTAHGTKDKRVDFVHAVELDKKLQAAGVPSLLYTIKDGGHGFKSDELNKRIIAFFNKNLRGMPADLKSEELAAGKW